MYKQATGVDRMVEPYSWLAQNGYTSASGYWREDDLQELLADRYEKQGWSVEREVWCPSDNGWGRADLILKKGNRTVVVEVKKRLTRESIYQSAMQASMYAQNLPGLSFMRFNKPEVWVIGFLPDMSEEQENSYKTARYIQDYKNSLIKELTVIFIDADEEYSGYVEPNIWYFLRKLFKLPRFNKPRLNVPSFSLAGLFKFNQTTFIALALLTAIALILADGETKQQDVQPPVIERRK